MTKKQRGFLFLLLLVGLSLFLYSFRITSRHWKKDQPPIDGPEIGTLAKDAQIGNVKKKFHVPTFTTKTPNEVSAKIMMQLLAEVVNSNQRVTDLLELLKATGQDPLAVQDKNSRTGSMTIIRTKNPLPNTRNFHAQYFGEAEDQFCQHISFEYRASPSAFDEAVKAVKLAFPNLGEPVQFSDGFVQWSLNGLANPPGLSSDAQTNSYVVWCKSLKKEDLVGDPFNAYSNEDIGTIRCALEINPE